MPISLHSPCPAFDLPVTPGETLGNSALLGAPFVLFLYPRDNTSTCTTEALAFAAALPAFAAQNCRVIGCSADSIASHKKFQARHGFDLPLLSDPDRLLIEPLGAWVLKKLYGRDYMGIQRSTFLFDARGKLQAEWRNIRVKGHVQTVLAAL